MFRMSLTFHAYAKILRSRESKIRFYASRIRKNAQSLVTKKISSSIYRAGICSSSYSGDINLHVVFVPFRKSLQYFFQNYSAHQCQSLYKENFAVKVQTDQMIVKRRLKL